MTQTTVNPPPTPQQIRQQPEPEPRVLCGLPVGGAVGILGSILMICQIFGLIYLSPFALYCFEIAIGSAMMFILSTGAKRRKLAYITAYMLYIAMYTFWVFFLILGAILATIYFVDNNDNICTTDIPLEKQKGCIDHKMTTGDVEMVVISCFFLSFSIIIAVIQMRYLMILYNFLRRCSYRLPSHSANPAGYNVQYIVPTPLSPSGMPPPPRYTVQPLPIPDNMITIKPPLGPPPVMAPAPPVLVESPILTFSEIPLNGADNHGYSNDEEFRGRAGSRPPAYSDVISDPPINITVRSESLS